jgi:hypothetical protein
MMLPDFQVSFKKIQALPWYANKNTFILEKNFSTYRLPMFHLLKKSRSQEKPGLCRGHIQGLSVGNNSILRRQQQLKGMTFPYLYGR